MASSFPGQVSVVQVGSYFLGQYYPFLQQNPNLVHQFYTNASTMIRYDGKANERASGMAEIHNLIVRLNFTEIEIKTAHSLESWDGGILVTVTGFVQIKDFICRRKFVETFFLAPQEKGYFVLNDIFLLLEEEQVHQHPTTMLAPNDFDPKLEALNYDRNIDPLNFDSNLDPLNHVQEPVSSYMHGEGIPAGEFITSPILSDENNQLDDHNAPERHNQTSDPDETIVENPGEQLPSSSVPSVQSIVRSSTLLEEEPYEERTKHTYASILRIARAQVAPQLASFNVMANSVPQRHLAQPITQATLSSSLPDKSSLDLSDEPSAFEDEGESKSVYIGNLSASISTSDLEHEFRNFGKIRPGGVTIRSRKEAGVFYAFVEFEDTAGVQNALKASPVQLNGKLIHVEGRRPNSGTSRGGRRGRGRGVGYFTETSRGRVGGRPLSGRADNNHDGRFRGNGHIQRLPRQEKGILGSHSP